MTSNQSSSDSPNPERPPICNYEGSDYQATFWDRGERAYEDLAEAIALRRLLPQRGDLLLELGAGAGRNTPRYENFERIVLLDYSTTQLRQAQERLGRSARYVYVAADVYALPFVAGLFDGATMIRTLHHMADARLALQETRRVLQPQARFILEFANKQNLKAILRYALRRQDWSPFSQEPVEFVRLNFDFHPAAIRTWLEAVGFGVRRQLTVSHFRIGGLKRLAPARVLAGLDGLAQLTGDWWQLSPSVFVLVQAVGATPVAAAGDFFRCPACGCAPLPAETGSNQPITCPECGQVYPVRDGIYDFRLPG